MGSGGGTSTTTVNTPAPTPEERELIKLNSELAKRQLTALDQIQPFQQELLDLALGDLRRQSTLTEALDAAVTPEEQAQALKAEFERAQRLGPVQDELLNLQLEQLRRGGAATPEQIEQIKAATDTAIEAGSSDIDIATQRGIGLIADELANARGLRLSDSPIKSEAALLAREGEAQKASLIKTLRAAEATAQLNHPLAVQQVQGGIALSQQNLADASRQFQADLRQRAFQNRLALTGQAGTTGLGLASINDGGRALATLTQSRLAGATTTQNATKSVGLGEIGQLAGGIGALAAFSDRKLKDDFGTVARTEEGIGLHVYKYKGEDPRAPLRLGVMADEVERVRPDAVATHRSGFKVVDYGKLR